MCKIIYFNIERLEGPLEKDLIESNYMDSTELDSGQQNINNRELDNSDIQQDQVRHEVLNQFTMDMVVHPPEYYLDWVHKGRNLHEGARWTCMALNQHFPGHHIPFSYICEYNHEVPEIPKSKLGMSITIEAGSRHLKPEHHRSRIGVDRLSVTPSDDQGNCNLIVSVEHYTKYVSHIRL